MLQVGVSNHYSSSAFQRPFQKQPDASTLLFGTQRKLVDATFSWKAKEGSSIQGCPYNTYDIQFGPKKKLAHILKARAEMLPMLPGEKDTSLLKQDRSLLRYIASKIAHPDSHSSHPVKVAQSSPEVLTDMLLRSLERYDPKTAWHSRRVGALAVLLGKQMQLSQTELHALDIAAKLHDIGKLGISSELLNLPGRVDKQEEKNLQQHPIFGDLITRALEFKDHLMDIPNIIRGHHERFDGKGYPSALKGEQIPKLTQIISVADMADALLSVRSYKKRQEFPLFIDILKKNQGDHLNPEVVEEFFQLPIKELTKIMNMDKDVQLNPVQQRDRELHLQNINRHLDETFSGDLANMSLSTFDDLYDMPAHERTPQENRAVDIFNAAYHMVPVENKDVHEVQPSQVHHSHETIHHHSHGPAHHRLVVLA